MCLHLNMFSVILLYCALQFTPLYIKKWIISLSIKVMKFTEFLSVPQSQIHGLWRQPLPLEIPLALHNLDRNGYFISNCCVSHAMVTINHVNLKSRIYYHNKLCPQTHPLVAHIRQHKIGIATL